MGKKVEKNMFDVLGTETSAELIKHLKDSYRTIATSLGHYIAEHVERMEFQSEEDKTEVLEIVEILQDYYNDAEERMWFTLWKAVDGTLDPRLGALLFWNYQR